MVIGSARPAGAGAGRATNKRFARRPLRFSGWEGRKLGILGCETIQKVLVCTAFSRYWLVKVSACTVFGGWSIKEVSACTGLSGSSVQNLLLCTAFRAHGSPAASLVRLCATDELI